MNEELEGNEVYGVAHLAAELVPSNMNPLFDGTVAQAYATLALAREQRATTLAILCADSSASPVDVADRARAELEVLLGWKVGR